MMTSSAGRGGEWEAGEGKEGQTSSAGGPNLHFQEALVSLLSLLHQCHYQSQEPHAHSHQREAICLPWVSLPIYHKRSPYQAHVHTHRREAIRLPSLSLSNSPERNIKESYYNTPFCKLWCIGCDLLCDLLYGNSNCYSVSFIVVVHIRDYVS